MIDDVMLLFQWTCLHDIQWPPAADLFSKVDEMDSQDVGSTSMTLSDVEDRDIPMSMLPLPNQVVQVSPPTSSALPATQNETRVEVLSSHGSRYQYVAGQCRTRRDNYIAVSLPRPPPYPAQGGDEQQHPSTSRVAPQEASESTADLDYGGARQTSSGSGPIRNARGEGRATSRGGLHSNRSAPYLQVRLSNEDFNAQFSITGETSTSQPRTFFIRTGPRSTGLPVTPGESANEYGGFPNIQFASRRTQSSSRTIVLLGGERTEDSWCGLYGRSSPMGDKPFVTLSGPLKHTPVYRRLMYSIEDSHVCRGFIKEQAFSPDGRLIVSPYGHGFRLLTYNKEVSELQNTDVAHSNLESPLTFSEPLTLFLHDKPVLCAKFSPTMPLIASGCIGGKVMFSAPRLG